MSAISVNTDLGSQVLTHSWALSYGRGLCAQSLFQPFILLSRALS